MDRASVTLASCHSVEEVFQGGLITDNQKMIDVIQTHPALLWAAKKMLFHVIMLLHQLRVYFSKRLHKMINALNRNSLHFKRCP